MRNIYKSNIPWNKGLKGVCKPNSGSFKKGNKVSKNRKMPTGSAHHLWKGKNVGNISLHQWVARHLGKPKLCEICRTTENRMYHWANKSHLYKRELTDWIRLCVPCHKKYDK